MRRRAARTLVLLTMPRPSAWKMPAAPTGRRAGRRADPWTPAPPTATFSGCGLKAVVARDASAGPRSISGTPGQCREIEVIPRQNFLQRRQCHRKRGRCIPHLQSSVAILFPCIGSRIARCAGPIPAVRGPDVAARDQSPRRNPLQCAPDGRHDKITNDAIGPASPQDITDDPAMQALAELLDAERTLATTSNRRSSSAPTPADVAAVVRDRRDRRSLPTHRASHRARAQRGVSPRGGADFQRWRALEVNPVLADRRLIDLFETAGARAVRACLSGETRLGYYLEALHTAAERLD